MKRMSQKQAMWLLEQSKDLLETALLEGEMPEAWKVSTRHIIKSIGRELEEIAK